MKVSLEDFKKGCNEVKWDNEVFHCPLTYNFNVHGARVDDRDFVRTCLSFTAITIMSEKFQDLILDSDIPNAREVYRQFISGERFYESLQEDFDTDIEVKYDASDVIGFENGDMGGAHYERNATIFYRIETISKVVADLVAEYLMGYILIRGEDREKIINSARYISVALMTRNAENGDK